ncbi:MAG: OsmC family protein [Cyanobacteria bacterium J06588_5]
MTAINVSSTEQHFQQNIAIRQFQLIADEPTELGGTDNGPTPTELAFASLGSCKAITLQMYAERKGWTLNHVESDISVEQIERKYHVSVRLKLTGDLTDEQRKRLLEISNKCPVHKLLSPGAEISTYLA